MFDLAEIKKAQSKAQEVSKEVKDNYQEVYNNALESLNTFAQNSYFDLDSLRLAADKFAEAANIKKNNPEPYFYLAYIFNYIGNKELAHQYMEIVDHMAPEMRGVKTLKKFMKAS
jgi:Tfp pilus assembly protein PilF